MKRILSLLFTFSLLIITSCGGKHYKNTEGGIIVGDIVLKAVNEKTIGLSPEITADHEFIVEETETTVLFKTSKIQAVISVPDNTVNFCDSTGKRLEGGTVFQHGNVTVSSDNWGKVEGLCVTVGDNMDEVINNIRAIQGRPGILPKWSLGYWYLGSEKSLKEFRDNHVSIDNIAFGDSQEIKNLHGHLVNASTKFERGVITFNTIEPSWKALESEVLTGPANSMCENPYWSIQTDAKDPQLQNRLYQLSAFLPVFATTSLPDTHYNKLRYSLIPYIYSLAGKAYLNGYTITRPLAMDFASDSIAVTIKDQYMFGPSLMVCPVYKNGEKQREVYLPEGNIWYDYNHPSKIYEGGSRIMADAPADRIPVFVPGGAILAIGQKSEYVGEVRKNDRVDLDIDIYAGKDGYFEIYDDDGESSYYKTGVYSIVPVTYIESPRTVIIGTRKGEFQGMQKARNVHVAIYDKGKMKAINVYYEGSKIKISL